MVREDILPRQLEIIYEINRRFLAAVRAQYPGDEARAARMSLIEDGAAKKVRMANLGNNIVANSPTLPLRLSLT